MGIIPIIMAGGSGSRLWPVSRDTMPKQFVSLFGDEISTFQATVRRVKGDAFERPIIVTNHTFRFVVGEQLAAAGVEADIVLEPVRRDSGPAVAIGAVLAAHRDASALCLLLASDHVIDDDAAFVADCRMASSIASNGTIVTFGIEPTEPSSSYGYLQPSETMLGENVFALERFVEKPDRETAEAYLKAGYLWNSGNLAFSAASMIEAFETHAPEVISAARGAVDASKKDLDFLRIDEAAFSAAPTISVDYAVMEKVTNAGVLKAGFGWSDVGTWDALHSILDKDADGNVMSGYVKTLGVTNSFVQSSGPLTTVLGLDNVIVVSTEDAVFVADKAKTGDVKTLVGALKDEGYPEASEHLRIHRPWGWYQRIDIGNRFQVKHILVKPGAALSLQRHFHRAEHWVVVQGTAEVTVDDTVKIYHENEAAYLPIGCVHRMTNPGKIDLKIIEVQVGSYTGEDDIVRIEDVYARV